MKEPKRITSFSKPDSFQKLGNDTYYYNYNIVETQKYSNKHIDGQQTKVLKTAYTFLQVLLYGQPDYKDCVQAIIREYLTQDEEFGLINSYNATVVAGETSSADITNYKEYLALLTTIKTNVKADFNA